MEAPLRRTRLSRETPGEAVSTVEGGVIKQLSVSQIEVFDHTQPGGCERKWWFERANDLRPDSNKAQDEGTAGHALLANYFLTGEKPKGRTLMGKAVTGAIVKGELPKPGTDLLVELRFDGQPKFGPDGKTWLPLDEKETLHLAGVPLEGFIDLAFRRADVPEIWDHKFFTPARPEISPDPYHFLKRGRDLIKTVQMPVYVLSQRPYWPDAQTWRIVHHCVSKKGVDSLIRSAVVHVDEVLERKVEIEAVIERMKLVAPVAEQDAVPFNRKSCDAFNGCPHQSICSAYKRRSTMHELTPEEAALFADLDSVPVPGSEAAPVAAAPAAEPTPAPAPVTEAAPPTAPKKRRAGQIIDMTGEAAATPTPSAPAPEVIPACACGTPITAENGSKLQSGEWKHIGCKLDAPPAPAKAKKVAPAKPAEAPAPVVSAPAPVAPVAHADSPRQVIAHTDPVVNLPVATIDLPAKGEARLVLADLFENIATLLRKVA